MSWLHRLRDTLQGARANATFDEEAQFHLDQRTEDNIRRGMAPEAARHDAIRRFGNRTSSRERTRDVDTLRWLGEFGQDVRYGLRVFRKHPGFSAVAIVTLALGIGATTAIFTIVNNVLVRPLPYHNADRLVRIVHNRPDKSHAALIKFTYFTALRDSSRAFEYVAAFDSYSNLGARQLEMTITTDAGPIGLAGTRVSPDLLRMLGFQTIVGRGFEREEDQEGHNRVVIISESVWRRYFGGDPGLLGKTLPLDHNVYTVIGIAPRGFAFPDRATDFWIPLTPIEIPPPSAPRSDTPDSAVVEVLASLKDGTSVEAASTDAEGIVRSVDRMYGAAGVPAYATITQRAELVPLKEELIGPVRPALQILPFAAGLVLLIACANVANLLLARGASRQREIAIRASLGAGRFRLIRQALTESTILSLAGGVAGSALGSAAIRLIQVLAPRDVPRLEEVRINLWVWLFAMAVSVVTALLSGAVPALRLAHGDHMEIIRESHAAESSGLGLFGRYRLRALLVIAEIAMATVLLVGAGLLVRSLTKLATVDPGYDARRVLTFQVVLPRERYPQDFYDALVARLESSPGVQFAGTIDKLPILGAGGFFLGLGRLPIQTAQDDRIVMRVVSQDYLRAMGTRVVQGRGLSSADGEGSPGVILINQTFQRRHFGQANPIGQFVSQGQRVFQIVGIVKDVRHGGIDVQPESEYYVDVRQSPVPLLSRPYVVVRAMDDPSALAATIRTAVHQIDPQAFVDLNIATMQEIVSNSIARPRFYAVLLGVFAAVALVLASVGIYGVIGYAVSERTQEIGIRLALGAARQDILSIVLGQGFFLLVVGLTIGLASGAGLTRFLRATLFGVTSLDPTTFAAVSVIFVAIAALAMYLPARRATCVDPLIAFRAQ